MTFKICDKCKGTNVKTLVPKLKILNPDAEIQIGCQGFCGIGRTKSFVLVGNMPVIAENEDALIEEVKNYIQKEHLDEQVN